MTRLNWSNLTRILFHICDAPCHGSRFHTEANDSYPEGDPRGLNIDRLLKELTAKNIYYYFAEVNKSTLRMIVEFDKELVAINGNPIKVMKLSSALDLPKSVTLSVQRSILESKSMSLHSTRGKSIKSILIDSRPVDWSEAGMKKYKAKYLSAKYNGSISELKTKSIEFDEKDVEIWIAPKPFAKGCMRFAYAGYVNVAGTMRKSVLKESIFKEKSFNTKESYEKLLENQVLAAFLAKKFFDILKMRIDRSVRFIDVNLICLPSEDKYLCIEDFIEGSFVKWMNNAGYVDEDIYSCTLGTFILLDNIKLYA